MSKEHVLIESTEAGGIPYSFVHQEGWKPVAYLCEYLPRNKRIVSIVYVEQGKHADLLIERWNGALPAQWRYTKLGKG